MKKLARTVLITFILGLLCAGPDSATSDASTKSTLTRYEDFVVLSGAEFSQLLEAEVSDFRMYSCEGGACAPVSVQIDKVDSADRYVFPDELNPDRDGSALDKNDEISFMAEDAGDRLSGGWWPKGATAGVEIELLDPLDNGRAWLYLFAQPGSPVPETTDYVSYSYDGTNTVIQSSQFVLAERDSLFGYDQMRLTSPGGELGPDILDRHRNGVELSVAGDISLALSVPESMVRNETAGIIDGPVRLVRDVMVMVHVGELSFDWGTEYYVRYYRCGHNNKVKYELPVSLKDLAGSILYYFSLDFTQDMIGSNYIDQNQPEPVVISNGPRKGVPNDAPHFWWGVYGDNGGVIQAVDLNEDLVPYFTCDGRWIQKPGALVKRGDDPGRLEIGFGCHEIGDMPDATEFGWSNYIMFPKDPSREGIIALGNIFQDPLQVKVRDLEWATQTERN